MAAGIWEATRQLEAAHARTRSARTRRWARTAPEETPGPPAPTCANICRGNSRVVTVIFVQIHGGFSGFISGVRKSFIEHYHL